MHTQTHFDMKASSVQSICQSNPQRSRKPPWTPRTDTNPSCLSLVLPSFVPEMNRVVAGSQHSRSTHSCLHQGKGEAELLRYDRRSRTACSTVRLFLRLQFSVSTDHSVSNGLTDERSERVHVFRRFVERHIRLVGCCCCQTQCIPAHEHPAIRAILLLRQVLGASLAFPFGRRNKRPSPAGTICFKAFCERLHHAIS